MVRWSVILRAVSVNCRTPAAPGHLEEGGGIDWSRVTASSILGLDRLGEVVEGRGEPELSGACIHLGVRRARPGARVIMVGPVVHYSGSKANICLSAHSHSSRHSTGMPEEPPAGDDPPERLQVPGPLCLGQRLPARHHDRGGGEAGQGAGGEGRPVHVSPRDPGQSLSDTEIHRLDVMIVSGRGCQARE